jgi:hypothetical protein
MDFPTGTTAAHGLQECQRRFLLEQTMDLNSIVWIIGICLTAQQRMDDQWLPLRAKNNGQGAMEPQSKDHMEVNNTKPNVFFWLWPKILGSKRPIKCFHFYFLVTIHMWVAI